MHATPTSHNAITRPTGNTFKCLGMGGNSTLEIENSVFSPFCFHCDMINHDILIIFSYSLISQKKELNILTKQIL